MTGTLLSGGENRGLRQISKILSAGRNFASTGEHDSSKYHKLISRDDAKKILGKKIFFDPLLGDFRFPAISEKRYFGGYGLQGCRKCGILVS